jgi:hypothetical protein
MPLAPQQLVCTNALPENSERLFTPISDKGNNLKIVQFETKLKFIAKLVIIGLSKEVAVNFFVIAFRFSRKRA